LRDREDRETETESEREKESEGLLRTVRHLNKAAPPIHAINFGNLQGERLESNKEKEDPKQHARLAFCLCFLLSLYSGYFDSI